MYMCIYIYLFTSYFFTYTHCNIRYTSIYIIIYIIIYNIFIYIYIILYIYICNIIYYVYNIRRHVSECTHRCATYLTLPILFIHVSQLLAQERFRQILLAVQPGRAWKSSGHCLGQFHTGQTRKFWKIEGWIKTYCIIFINFGGDEHPAVPAVFVQKDARVLNHSHRGRKTYGCIVYSLTIFEDR